MARSSVIAGSRRGEQPGEAHEGEREAPRDHEHQRQREPGAGPEGEDDPLHQRVFPVGLEDRQGEDRAIGGDEREGDAQRAEGRRGELLDHHFDDLHEGGDDDDEGDESEVGRVREDEGVEGPHRERRHDEDERVRGAHAERGVDLARDPEEGAEAEKEHQREVVDQHRGEEDPREVAHHAACSAAASPGASTALARRALRRAHQETVNSTNARVKKPPGGSTMMTHGSYRGPKRLTPRNVPLPSTSRTEPMISRVITNPIPMPTASSTERPTGFFPAKASWRPRMMQFTTIRATKAPSAL